jgi:hypothetical protein
MGQYRDKHAEYDSDSEPRNRKPDRLARMKTDELVLVVRLEIKKNQAGDEAQQIGQRGNHVALRFSRLTVHRESSFSSRTMILESDSAQHKIPSH